VASLAQVCTAAEFGASSRPKKGQVPKYHKNFMGNFDTVILERVMQQLHVSENELETYTRSFMTLRSMQNIFKDSKLGSDVVEIIFMHAVIKTYKMNVLRSRVFDVWVTACGRVPPSHIRGKPLTPTRNGSERMVFLRRMYERHPVTAGVKSVGALLYNDGSHTVLSLVAFCKGKVALEFSRFGIFMKLYTGISSPRYWFRRYCDPLHPENFIFRMPCVYGEELPYSHCMNFNPMSHQVAALASKRLNTLDRFKWIYSPPTHRNRRVSDA